MYSAGKPQARWPPADPQPSGGSHGGLQVVASSLSLCVHITAKDQASGEPTDVGFEDCLSPVTGLKSGTHCCHCDTSGAGQGLHRGQAEAVVPTWPQEGCSGAQNRCWALSGSEENHGTLQWQGTVSLLSLDPWLVVNMGNVTGNESEQGQLQTVGREERQGRGFRGEPPHRGRLWIPTAGAMAE